MEAKRALQLRSSLDEPLADRQLLPFGYWIAFSKRSIGHQFLTENFGMRKDDFVRIMRAWIATRLGIKDEAAQDGSWWEIDAVIVLLLGSAVLGLAAWIKL